VTNIEPLRIVDITNLPITGDTEQLPDGRIRATLRIGPETGADTAIFDATNPDDRQLLLKLRMFISACLAAGGVEFERRLSRHDTPAIPATDPVRWRR
jgi:hypothetical protein